MRYETELAHPPVVRSIPHFHPWSVFFYGPGCYCRSEGRSTGLHVILPRCRVPHFPRPRVFLGRVGLSLDYAFSTVGHSANQSSYTMRNRRAHRSSMISSRPDILGGIDLARRQKGRGGQGRNEMQWAPSRYWSTYSRTASPCQTMSRRRIGYYPNRKKCGKFPGL